MPETATVIQNSSISLVRLDCCWQVLLHVSLVCISFILVCTFVHKLCQPRYWPPIHQISSTSTSPTILSLLCAFPVLPGKIISTISFKMLRGKCIQHAHRHTHHTYSTHRGLIHVQVNLASTQPACLQHSLLQAVQPVRLSPHGCQPNLGTLTGHCVPLSEEQMGFGSKSS